MKMPRNIGPVHFIGIGGIGMSGIAEILHNQNYVVRGSDIALNPNVQRLRDMGRSAASDWLHRHRDAVGVRSSVDIESTFLALRKPRKGSSSS